MHSFLDVDDLVFQRKLPSSWLLLKTAVCKVPCHLRWGRFVKLFSLLVAQSGFSAHHSNFLKKLDRLRQERKIKAQIKFTFCAAIWRSAEAGLGAANTFSIRAILAVLF